MLVGCLFTTHVPQDKRILIYLMSDRLFTWPIKLLCKPRAAPSYRPNVEPTTLTLNDVTRNSSDVIPKIIYHFWLLQLDSLVNLSNASRSRPWLRCILLTFGMRVSQVSCLMFDLEQGPGRRGTVEVASRGHLLSSVLTNRLTACRSDHPFALMEYYAE
jgi:hypothetical protein